MSANRTIRVEAAQTGGGKSHRAMLHVSSSIKNTVPPKVYSEVTLAGAVLSGWVDQVPVKRIGTNTLIASITRDLSKQTCFGLRESLLPSNEVDFGNGSSIAFHDTDTLLQSGDGCAAGVIPTSVSESLISSFDPSSKGGYIEPNSGRTIHITHKALLMNIVRLPRKHDWNLIIDESLDCIGTHTIFVDEKHVEEFAFLFSLLDINDLENVQPKDKSAIAKLESIVKGHDRSSFWKATEQRPLAEHILSPSVRVHLITEGGMLEGAKRIDFGYVLDIEPLTKFNEVTFLAADAFNTLTVRLLKSKGLSVVDAGLGANNNQHCEFDGQVTIVHALPKGEHFSRRYVQDEAVMQDMIADMQLYLGDEYAAAINKPTAEKLINALFDGTSRVRLPGNPQGRNDFKNFANIGYLLNRNPSPVQINFMCGHLDITPEELWDSYAGDPCYQTVARGAIRTRDADRYTGDIVYYVPDYRHAKYIADRVAGAVIEESRKARSMLKPDGRTTKFSEFNFLKEHGEKGDADWYKRIKTKLNKGEPIKEKQQLRLGRITALLCDARDMYED